MIPKGKDKLNAYTVEFLTGNFFLVFLFTIDGQQSSLVWCHNDTLACSTLRLHNYFRCLELWILFAWLYQQLLDYLFWTFWEPL